MTKEQILQEAKALQNEIMNHRLWLHALAVGCTVFARCAA